MHVAVAANSNPQFDAWRSVESQQKGATLALVDNDLEAQLVLENILDSAKPPVPAGFMPVDHLHFLLWSPFRYEASIHGTRFGAPHTAGIFYAADEKITAMAETGYWNTRFAAASDGLSGRSQALQRTLFKVRVGGPAVDVRLPPFDATPGAWSHTSDYSATWDLGRAVREVGGIDLIRFNSVRDEAHRGCVAVFHPRAFKCTKPLAQEDWSMHVQGSRAVFMRNEEHFAFAF